MIPNKKMAFNSRNLRICQFYVVSIEEKYNVALMADIDDVDSCLRSINRFISNTFKNNHDIDEFLGMMSRECKDQILDESDFSWIKNSERITFWVWSQLYLWGDFKAQMPPSFYANTKSENGMSEEYISLKLNPRPQSSQERYKIILNYFDWAKGNRITKKKDILIDYENEWSKLYKVSKEIFTWLNENDDDACSWAYEYSITHQKNNYHNFAGVYPISLPVPLTSKEKYLTVCALHDLWYIGEDTKKLFLININKAWNQKKLRKEMKNKKAINSYVDIEVKQRLEFLSSYYDKKINETLEIIITEKYNELIFKKH